MTAPRARVRALTHLIAGRPGRVGLAALVAAALAVAAPLPREDSASAKRPPASEAGPAKRAKAKTARRAKSGPGRRKEKDGAQVKGKAAAGPRAQKKAEAKAKPPATGDSTAKKDAVAKHEPAGAGKDAGASAPADPAKHKPAGAGSEGSAAPSPASGSGAGSGKSQLPRPAHAPSGSPAPSPATPSAVRPAASPGGAPAAPAAAKRRAPRRRVARRSARRPAQVELRARPTLGEVVGTGGPSLRPVATLGRAGSGTRREAEAEAERPSEGGGSPVAPVTRTVRDIVEVVPAPLKWLLGALAALSAALGGGYLLVAARARRLERHRGELLQEVGLLQAALLPPVPPMLGAVRSTVAYRPSDGPAAGGDFYDALTLDGGRAAFVLGDVSGHGRAALGRTAFVRYTLRAYLEAGLEPRMALQVAGRVVDEHLGGDFVTALVAVHDPATGSLTYASAGHPAPIVLGNRRPHPVLAASSPPIGLGLRTGLRQTTLPLPPGSLACLYTDGLTEARTSSGILGRPRLSDLIEELGPDVSAAQVLDAVSKEAAQVSDDMAAVVLSPVAGATAGGFRTEQLEVDASELDDGLAERFLEACGAGLDEIDAASRELRVLCERHGGAVVHVRFGIRGAAVEVLPRNVESLEAASKRALALVSDRDRLQA